ncbi:hypothetical protein TorRG33x02_182130 [Trema orientale]|uniref:Neprosin PEP catalytic domain-containing protein n=1 Tax=Trema orientale TaxID=63057 RepID=A0A2P5EKB4_TREOI|nr:hypothetical protein TorRG33x02_182130 [Trema orientale]
MITALFILSFCLRSYGYTTLQTANNQKEKDLEIQSQLQNLYPRSPIIKTIQIDNGDIIDCVDINRQPSLDHPLLKNHKVQRIPSVFPPEIMKRNHMKTESESAGFSTTANCPYGTVPIYRTKKDLVEKAKNVSSQMFRNVGRHSPNTLSTNPDDHQVFLRKNKTKTFRYYGAVASISVYDLNLKQDQSSSANIWVESGPPDLVSVLIAGLMVMLAVSPSINGDSTARLFVYWSVDGGQKTGCYNLHCKGFIQVHPRIAPGSRIWPVSTIGGQTYEMKILIYRDPMTGNWWFVAREQNDMIGYWPKELVPYLGKAATDVAWGGIALAGNDGNSPPMGSGEYPDGFYDRAAYFRDIRYLKKGLKQVSPTNEDVVDEIVDVSKCYGLQNDKLTRSDFWGYRFAFGGPGGGSRCR